MQVHLDVSLGFEAEASVGLAHIVENIPLGLGESKVQRVRVESRDAGSGNARTTLMRLHAGCRG